MVLNNEVFVWTASDSGNRVLRVRVRGRARGFATATATSLGLGLGLRFAVLDYSLELGHTDACAL